MIAALAFVVGIAFGGWLRGSTEIEWRRSKEDHYYRGRFRRGTAWDVAVGVKSLFVVAGCGLVRHRWKVSAIHGSDQIVECQRCGKVDWHPTKGPNAPEPRHKTPALWDGPRRNAVPKMPASDNQLTEFGSDGYTVVSKQS